MPVDIGKVFKLKDTVGIADNPSYKDIGSFVTAILPNVYLIAGIILFGLFIAGGFAIMTAGADPEKQKKGSETLTAAVVGFIIVFASYWIIQIISYIFFGEKYNILNPGV